MAKKHTIADWQRFFPFPTPRPEQETAINFILDSFSSGINYVCADLATGIGKSAIAVTVARYLRSSSYILTTQKILQDQYDNDFGDASAKLLLKTIKSSSNYRCSHYCTQSCRETKDLLKSLGDEIKGTPLHDNCTRRCVYSQAKQAFLDHELGVTNFAYFLAETMYSGKLEPRNLLIIDESHNTESEISKNVSLSITEQFSKNVLNIKTFPKGTMSEQEIVAWISTKYVDAAKKRLIATNKSIIEHFRGKTDEKIMEQLSKQYSMLDKHVCKINRFIKFYAEDNWALTFERSKKTQSKRIEFKPVDISKFAQESLFSFGKKVLMMSATIINKDAFCRSVGLPPNKVAYLHIPCPFPKENRLVHVLSVGKMSYKNIDMTLPIIAQTVEELLKQHPDEKGIVHCVSYKVAQYLIQNVKSDRLLTHNSENRDQVLEQHKMTAAPTVLVSPSMSEGVDLADEASRFQILCKMPFPPLNDELVKKRMRKDRDWYAYQTLKTIIQSLGRSVRNENDHAVSYILDEDWVSFRRRNGHMFSADFLSVLR